MRYIEFGEEKRRISEIMLGLMRIDEMSVRELRSFIENALEEGINALDIADCYACGKCESLLGEVFAEAPSLRDKVFLQSKCGIRRDPDFTYFDFSGKYILEAVDASLRRLKSDSMDCLLLHRPDVLMETDEIAEAFKELHREGKVKNFGVSNFNPMMMELLKRDAGFPIEANQLQLSCAFTPAFDAGLHVNMETDTAIVRDGSVFEYCRLHDIVIQAWSSMQYGFFEGVFIGSPKYPELNKVLSRIAKEKGTDSTAIALAWILRYPGRMQAVIGTTKKERVKAAAGACGIELTRKEWYEIYLSAGNDLP